MPDVPEPTSFYLTKDFYITQKEILATVIQMLKLDKSILKSLKSNNIYHDVPGDWFEGPF